MFQPRISLRWFLIATAGFAALVGTVGKRAYDDWRHRNWLARQMARQIQIRDELRALGCGVRMSGLNDDGQVAIIHLTTVHVAKAMSLLKEATDLEELRAECPLTDDDMATLDGLLKLRRLDVAGSGITDRSLLVVGTLTQLEFLGIGQSKITDDGLALLRDLKQLNWLFVGDTPIHGRGVAYLAQHPKLQTITLLECAIDDDGLAGLAECTALVELDLGRTKVTGPGLAHLRQLPNLKTLRLEGTHLTSGEGLAELDQVETLYLAHAPLEPGIVRHLAEMDSLAAINLSIEQVPKDEVAEFESLLRRVNEHSLKRQPVAAPVTVRGPPYPTTRRVVATSYLDQTRVVVAELVVPTLAMSFRELVLLAVVLALAFGWWLDRRRLAAKIATQRTAAQRSQQGDNIEV